jgi:protein-S-isoprenylcysteine O-methyltransferase Ste14
LIEPVARRTLATMKTLVEAGAASPDTAVALAADPAGPLPARDDPRAGLLSWLPWALWLGTSLVWSRWSRRTLAASGESRRREEPTGAWRGHLAAFAATFALLAPAIPAGPLDRPFPLGRWTRRKPALGLAVEAAGFGLAFWARLTLGRYCTARVAVASGQPLVRRGPYGVIRHPLYAGLLLGVLGQALVLGRWRGLAALATLASAYRRKAGYEEAALRRHCGTEWEAYAATVPAVLPRRRRSTSRPGGSASERSSR